MRVDQPRHQHPALAVEPVVRPSRALVATLEQLFDAAVVVDQQGGEALDPALRVKGNALDILDKGVGPSRLGGGGGECEEQSRK